MLYKTIVASCPFLDRPPDGAGSSATGPGVEPSSFAFVANKPSGAWPPTPGFRCRARRAAAGAAHDSLDRRVGAATRTVSREPRDLASVRWLWALCGRGPMSVRLDPEQLAYELGIRGMSALDLARKAGLSPATVSAALAGRRISSTSHRLIAAALAATPVDEVAKRLLDPGGHGIEGRPAKPKPLDGEAQELERVCPLGAHCGLCGVRARIIAS